MWGGSIRDPLSRQPLGRPPKEGTLEISRSLGCEGLKGELSAPTCSKFYGFRPSPPPRALLGLETSQRAGRGPFSRLGPGMPLQGPPHSRPCTHFAEGKADIRGAAAGAWTPRLPFAPARLGVERYAVPAPEGLQILSCITPTPARRPQAGSGAGPPAIMTGSAACGWRWLRKPERSGYFWPGRAHRPGPGMARLPGPHLCSPPQPPGGAGRGAGWRAQGAGAGARAGRGRNGVPGAPLVSSLLSPFGALPCTPLGPEAARAVAADECPAAPPSRRAVRRAWTRAGTS